MNIKKILIISIVLIAIASTISFVTAGGSDSIEVNGINFNLGDFKEAGSDSSVDSIFTSLGYNSENKIIKNGNDKKVVIQVVENSSGDVPVDRVLMLKNANFEVSNKTYGGKEGICLTNSNDRFSGIFGYADNGKLVILYGNPENFDDIIK